ncbi:MAG: DUF4258 domain-containing protein [Chloroflexota bacterium]
MFPSELGDLVFSAHAEDRLQEYSLTKLDVLYVMRDPDITRPAAQGKQNLVRTLPNGLRIRVPAVEQTAGHWFVITVIRENGEALP